MTIKAQIKKITSSAGLRIKDIDFKLFEQILNLSNPVFVLDNEVMINLNRKKEVQQVKEDFVIKKLGQSIEYSDLLIKKIKNLLKPNKEVYKTLFYYLIVKEITSTEDKLSNIHPGEILKEEFLDPMGISAYRLSKEIGIPQTRTSSIIKGDRKITADTALRLSKYFGNSAKFWLGLQNDYDIEESNKEKILDIAQINKIDTGANKVQNVDSR